MQNNICYICKNFKSVKKMKKSLLCLILFCLGSIGVIDAQDEVAQEEVAQEGATNDTALVSMLAQLAQDTIVGQTGRVDLKEANAYINVPEGYLFLDNEAANHLLVDYWDNLRDEDILGALVTDSAKIYYNLETIFLVYYEDCGYVKDDDASTIDYDDLLKDLQEETKESNEEREKAGLEPVELVGWAATPYYDANEKTLYWAKRFAFGSDEDTVKHESLNYDIRILGRKGMLTMKAVAGVEDLPAVEEMKGVLLKGTSFTEGNTYADYNSATDHVAEFGIGALVAGKLLAKVGILAKLGVFFAKFWKLIVVAVAAVVGFFTKIFGKKKEDEKTDDSQK